MNMSKHRDTFQLLLDLKRRRGRTEEEMLKVRQVELELHRKDADRAKVLLDRISQQLKKNGSGAVSSVTPAPIRLDRR